MRSALGRAWVGVAAASLVAGMSGAASAGGGSFGQDEDQPNTRPYFGSVTDPGGNPLEDARIVVNFKDKNSSLIMRSDSEGHFVIQGIEQTVDPTTIEIACAKDGYKEVAHTSAPQGLDQTTPVELDCVLAPAK